MNVHEQITESFNVAIDAIFEANFSLSPQKVTEKHSFNEKDAVISVLEFTGKYEGSFFLHIPFADARKIVSIMLNNEVSEDSPDIFDGLGETVNMISGIFKKNMGEDGKEIEVSVPACIKGKSLDIKGLEKFNKVESHYLCEEVMFSCFLVYHEVLDE